MYLLAQSLPSQMVHSVDHKITILLAMFNSSINPVVYSFTSSRFRQHVAKLFRCKCSTMKFATTLKVLRGLCPQNDVTAISWHPRCPKNRMKHSNNHLKLLNNIKEIQQKKREAWINIKGQDWNGLHLGNLEKNRPDVFQFLANRLDKGPFCSESYWLWCNDNFISKGIPHCYSRDQLKFSTKRP